MKRCHKICNFFYSLGQISLLLDFFRVVKEARVVVSWGCDCPNDYLQIAFCLNGIWKPTQINCALENHKKGFVRIFWVEWIVIKLEILQKDIGSSKIIITGFSFLSYICEILIWRDFYVILFDHSLYGNGLYTCSPFLCIPLTRCFARAHKIACLKKGR